MNSLVMNSNRGKTYTPQLLVNDTAWFAATLVAAASAAVTKMRAFPNILDRVALESLRNELIIHQVTNLHIIYPSRYQCIHCRPH